MLWMVFVFMVFHGCCMLLGFCLVCGGGFLGVDVSGLVSRFIYVIERVE